MSFLYSSLINLFCVNLIFEYKMMRLSILTWCWWASLAGHTEFSMSFSLEKLSWKELLCSSHKYFVFNSSIICWSTDFGSSISIIYRRKRKEFEKIRKYYVRYTFFEEDSELWSSRFDINRRSKYSHKCNILVLVKW